jgi:dienelactone hydrolase
VKINSLNGLVPMQVSVQTRDDPFDMASQLTFRTFSSVNLKKSAVLILSLLEDMKKQHREIEGWAIMEFCWGGKMAALIAVNGGFFKAAVQCHSSLLDVEDVKNVAIPMCALPGMDESIAMGFAPLHNLLVIGAPCGCNLVRFCQLGIT